MLEDFRCHKDDEVFFHGGITGVSPISRSSIPVHGSPDILYILLASCLASHTRERKRLFSVDCGYLQIPFMYMYMFLNER